jgi:AraC family transcriptional regulator
MRLLDTPLALVENLLCRDPRSRRSPEAFSPDFQVCMPYCGLFIWHAGGDDVVGDANQVLFVSGGESYHLTHPVDGIYAELIITPDPETLAEIAHASESRLPSHPLFRRRSRLADPALQCMRARYLHRAANGVSDETEREELVLTLLRLALQSSSDGCTATSRTRRLIARTKEFLEAHLCGPVRLADVSRAVGASPAYLTDVFRRVEGLPLHRYLVQLRLARALVELPHADDLTTLAFNLGFSSHSHFTAVFGRAFGCTPSEFRQSTRRPLRSRRFECGRATTTNVTSSSNPPPVHRVSSPKAASANCSADVCSSPDSHCATRSPSKN